MKNWFFYVCKKNPKLSQFTRLAITSLNAPESAIFPNWNFHRLGVAQFRDSIPRVPIPRVPIPGTPIPRVPILGAYQHQGVQLKPPKTFPVHHCNMVPRGSGGPPFGTHDTERQQPLTGNNSSLENASKPNGIRLCWQTLFCFFGNKKYLVLLKKK